MATEFGSSSDGVAFLVSADVVFTIIAAFCSSPQTAEINADKRAATLMKWVWLGLGASVLFLAVAMQYEKRKAPFMFGGALAGGTLGVAYVYAKRSGLKSGGQGTESY